MGLEMFHFAIFKQFLKSIIGSDQLSDRKALKKLIGLDQHNFTPSSHAFIQ